MSDGGGGAVLFPDATEAANWSAAELIYDIAPLEPHNWFYTLDHIHDAKWFARNTANCAFSFLTRMKDNLAIFNSGVPRCARRLKRLLIYFLWVLEDFLYKIYDDLTKTNNGATTQNAIQIAYGYAKVWLLNLRASLEQMDQRMAPLTFALNKHTDLNTINIPAESMHELLGSFYIWTEQRLPGGPQRLENPTNVRNLLRTMMTTIAVLDPPNQKATDMSAEDPKLYKTSPPTQKYGIPECIFSTRATNDVSTLMVGSTNPNYPETASTVVRTANQKLVIPDPDDTRIPSTGGIKAVFKNARLERLSTAARTELEQRFRMDDYDYMAPLASIDMKVLPSFNLPLPNDGTSRAIVNFYAKQRERTTANWKMFNHQDQTATSFLVVPGDRDTFLDGHSNEWFQPVPRCMKCRIIQSYIIPKLETAVLMDKYMSINPPLCCAEDIVHAKLRILNPSTAAPDITPPAPEATLAAQDAAANAAGTGDASTAIQGLAQAAATATDTAKDLKVRIARLEAVVQKAFDEENAPVPQPAPLDPNTATTGETKKYEAALKKATAEVTKRRQAATDVRARGDDTTLVALTAQYNSIPPTRAALLTVHTYLQSHRTPDASGEDAIRAPQDV